MALIVLKFSALIIGGIFAAIGLLTEYRDRKGRVTRWGKVALFGIVLSTIVAAGTQAIESQRERATRLANDIANRKAEQQTQDLLREIKRAIYPFRSVTLKSFFIFYPSDLPPISTFLKDVPPIPETKRLQPPIFLHDSFWPKDGIMLDIVEPHLSLRVWTKGSDTSQPPDLEVKMEKLPKPAVIRGRTSFEVMANDHSIPNDHLKISHKLASLEDMIDGEIQIELHVDQLDPAVSELLKKTSIHCTLLISNHHELDATLNPKWDESEYVTFNGKLSAQR